MKKISLIIILILIFISFKNINVTAQSISEKTIFNKIDLVSKLVEHLSTDDTTSDLALSGNFELFNISKCITNHEKDNTTASIDNAFLTDISYYSNTDIPTYTYITGRQLSNTTMNDSYIFYNYVYNVNECAHYMASLEECFGFYQYSWDDYSEYSIITFIKNNTIVLVAPHFINNQVSIIFTDINCGECGENLSWSYSDGTLKISGKGNMDNYDDNNSWPWFDIIEDITKVIVEHGVESIGTNAFNDLYNMTEITLPSTLTSIGSNAFYGCTSLTNIRIPNSVICIESSAFDFTYLVNIDVDIYNKNYSSINGNLFNKDKTKLIHYARGKKSVKYTIPSCVTNIEEYAFSGCSNLTSVVIPNSVTSIGNCAFMNCSDLTSMMIPDSVTSIGGSAFSGCTDLTDIDIPNSVTSIGSAAFLDCSALVSVKLPNYLKEISSMTFMDCTNLVNIEIPNSVVKIGRLAFNGCKNLRKIIIPHNITYIDHGAFCGCENLKYVSTTQNITFIGGDVFEGCSNDMLIYGYKNTVAEQYAKVNNISFSVFPEYGDIKELYVTEVVYNQEDSTITIPVTIKQNVTEKIIATNLYVASYKNNTITNITFKTINIATNEYDSSIILKSVKEKPDYIKVFAFDYLDGISPLCKSTEKKI